jgi:hypothetical protein
MFGHTVTKLLAGFQLFLIIQVLRLQKGLARVHLISEISKIV